MQAAWGVLLAGLITAAGLGAVPAVASAEEQPSILKAYGLDWIERVREEAWPQPKAERPVICLLDTGVNVTPDTPADDPNGPIVARLALDGGTGVAQGAEWQHLHGTDMASIIAAPRNGYGTVGVFPQARIVSIRVTEGAETYITPADVLRGVRRCIQWGQSALVRVAAIVIAETNYEQREVERPYWQDAAAYGSDAVIVAAVGNRSDARPVPPLGIDRMIAVAAADARGAPCDFSPDLGTERVLLAPGCGAAGWPPGSSAAAAVAAAVVGATATRIPTAAAGDVATRVLPADGTTGASVLSGQRAESAFGGLIDLLPASPQWQDFQAEVVDDAPQSEARLWRPRVSARWRHGRLRLVRLDHHGGRLRLEYRRGARTFRRTLSRGRAFRLKLERRPARVTVWAEGGEQRHWRSLSRRVRVF